MDTRLLGMRMVQNSWFGTNSYFLGNYKYTWDVDSGSTPSSGTYIS